MPSKGEKVVVAMSGGVDSSVAACLLIEQGYDVVGLFMRHGASTPESVSIAGCSSQPQTSLNSTEPQASACATVTTSVSKNTAAESPRSHQGCCSASDASDARFVAGLLGIPFYALNFEDDFDELIDYFADEYARGRTPNPCVVCNDKLKFGRIVEYADAIGARYVATGHYARTHRRGNRNVLLKAVDGKKDQSYVLFGLSRDVLDRVMFPVGDLTKPQVREIATRYNLPNRDKPDSVEICFVPDRNYARIVRERRPDAFRAGAVVDASGRVLGSHEGIANYTIGQRRGLGIAAGRPVYVTELNVETNTVTLGDENELTSDSLIASRVNLLTTPTASNPEPQASACATLPSAEPQALACATAHDSMDECIPEVVPRCRFRAEVKIRYLHTAAPATVTLLDHNRARVDFDEPQRAITPGQAVVFYDGDVVLGGGWIDKPM